MSFERQFGILEPVPLVQSASIVARATTLTYSQASVRRKVLERTALELFERSFFDHRHLFPNWEEFASVLQKSIQGGFLEHLRVFGTRKGEFVFSLELTIDWEKHQILANEVAFTKLDPNKSIADQVEDALPQIIDFIREKAKAFRIDSVAPTFTYKDADEPERRRQRQVAGTSPISGVLHDRLRSFEANSEGHSVTPGRLKEMTIQYRLRVT
jgi:hypothetical protein